MEESMSTMEHQEEGAEDYDKGVDVSSPVSDRLNVHFRFDMLVEL